MRTEQRGVFNGIHMRLRAREDGILQVTRDLDGQFRETAYSPVCPCGSGTWTEVPGGDSEGFELLGLRVWVNREDSTVPETVIPSPRTLS